jgi:hypothetical protein
MSAMAQEWEPEDYWSAARRPLCALAFLLPILTAYELGVWFLNLENGVPDIRNGADSWMRGWLLAAGFEHVWLLPTLLIVVLGGWHLHARDPWRCSGSTLLGMLAESLLFAFALIVLGQLLSLAFQHVGVAVACVRGDSAGYGQLARAVSFLGAGLYEEFLFRMALLPLCVLVLRRLMPTRSAIIAAVVMTSLVFAAAHYITSASDLRAGELAGVVQKLLAEQSLWFGFTFRLLAGAVFSTLFFTRGFGVTVGCHAIYDLLVGVVMHPAGETG